MTVDMNPDSQVVIKISDTGCGIPKSFRSSLFQPFRQADSSLTRPKQGTGLGLSIVKHLVQRMSGTVNVESAEGDGCTFTVTIPVTVPMNSPQIQPTFASKHIKVVHRNEKTARLYVELWTKHGFTASVVSQSTTLADLVKDADIIWADFDSVSRVPALGEVLHADPLRKLPPLFVVYADARQLTSLPALSTTDAAVLVKRPIIMDTLLEPFQNPEARLGTHVMAPSRVRFDLPPDKVPLTPEEQRRDIAVFKPARVPTPVPQSSQSSVAERHRDRVLLVEDNMVRLLVSPLAVLV